MEKKTKNAIIREVFEETGGAVAKAKYISKCYYSVDWEYKDIKFPSKRVEYFYLCELTDCNVHIKGLEGEFNKNIKLAWHTIEELEMLKLPPNELELMKKLRI